jgi:hypothetical protein
MQGTEYFNILSIILSRKERQNTHDLIDSGFLIAICWLNTSDCDASSWLDNEESSL